MTILEFKPKEEKEQFVYACACKKDDPNNYHSHFYVCNDGYECVECGKFHSFEQVHGSI